MIIDDNRFEFVNFKIFISNVVYYENAVKFTKIKYIHKT